MRQLDRALQDEDTATSARLLRTLDRYADWLSQLPEEDRQVVLSAGSDLERIQHIKQIRNREWVLRQPKAIQDELRRLPAAEQSTRIAQLRKQDADFRNHWELAIVYWDQLTKLRNQPEKFSDDLRIFIKDFLVPRLSADEKKQLLELKDKWPLFEMKLVELADKHPVRFPGLGRPRQSDLPEALQNFIKNELQPVLKPSEKKALADAEGHLPEYPRTIQRLAREHKLPIPGMALPGPRDLWEPFRRKSATKHDFLPELPDRTLLDFANLELTPEERASLPSMSLQDPQSREEWRRAYFMRHPEVLKVLKNQDVRKERTTKQN
jgi:hypothetical protein